MKITTLTVAIFSLLISACGYLPVRTPFTISGTGYNEEWIDKESIRILSWNIHKEGSLNKWKNEFIDLVNNKKPSIILLQEVRLEGKTMDFVSADLKYGWEFSPNTYQSEYDAYSGVLTASHAKPVKVDSALSSGLEPFSDTPKTVLFTKYFLSSSTLKLLVVNIHGINFQISLDKFKEQLRFISEVIGGHNGPVIMAGDFNTWNENRLEHLTNITTEMGLVEVDFGSESVYIETTFGNPLDHIFYTDSELEIQKTSLDVLEKLKSSDHKALFVEFKVLHSSR